MVNCRCRVARHGFRRSDFTRGESEESSERIPIVTEALNTHLKLQRGWSTNSPEGMSLLKTGYTVSHGGLNEELAEIIPTAGVQGPHVTSNRQVIEIQR